jgi:hypothetical protein
VYLQNSTGDEETMRAKHAFEAYSQSHGVSIHHYHADNGIFAANKWLAHTEAKKKNPSHSMELGHTSSKWRCQKTYPGLARIGKDHDAACSPQVAHCSIHSTLALCAALGKPSQQQHAHQGHPPPIPY